MARSRLSYAFLGSFILTIFFLQFWEKSAYPPWLWSILGILGLLGFAGLIVKNVRNLSVLTLMATAGISFAFFSVSHAMIWRMNETISSFTGQNLEFEGVIRDEPDHRGLRTIYIVEALHIRGKEHEAVSGRVLVTDRDGLPRLHYGDRVAVSGTLESTGDPRTSSYAAYLSTKRIASVMSRSGVKLVEQGQGSAFFGWLLALKERFQRQLNRIFPEPEAALLSGLLLGTRGNMPDHLEEDFRTSGLAHLTAISGYNITLVLQAIEGMLFFVTLRLRLLLSMIAIVVFTLLVGGSASAVRAAIMGILGLLALHTGRQKHLRLMILWTLFLMTVRNPALLWHDPGLQLSFLAVTGMSELVPILEKRLGRIPNILGARGNLAATLAAQSFVLPVLAHHFGSFSIVAPLTNVLAAPAVPAAMLLGSVGTIVSFLTFPLGQLISFGGFGYLLWIERAAELLARVPFAEIMVKKPGAGTIVLYYALLYCVIFMLKHGTRRPFAHRFEAGCEGLPKLPTAEYGIDAR